MQITVTGQQIDIGDTLRERAETETAAAVAKYFEDAIKVWVSFSKERSRTLINAEIGVHPIAGIELVAEAEDVDAYHAFDLALAKITKQLGRAKERVKTSKKHRKMEE